MIKKLWPMILFMGLSSCAALQDFANVLIGNSSQKITRTPIWVYRPDLVMQVGDQVFYGGMGVVPLPIIGGIDVKIWSQVDIDRVEISTCSRHDVCQKKGGALACDSTRFTVTTDWFGNPEKFMTYHFVPDRKERDDSCANAMIAVYDKNTLGAWGFMDFRGNVENTFPSRMTCNASDIAFDGVSVCSAKAGTIQQISFDQPIDNFRAEASCGIKKTSDGQYDFYPAMGWCRASFGSGVRYHDVIINAYDEVLIRDGKE